MFLIKKWGILIKKESESLIFIGLKIPRDYKKTMDERIEFLKQYSVSAPFSDNKRKIKEKQEKENKQENIFYKLFLKIKRKFVV